MAAPDLATLGVKIDASSADTAAQKLDNLANTGERTEQSTTKVTSATNTLKGALSAIIGAINSNTTATGALTSQIDRLKNSSNNAGDSTTTLETRLARLKASVDPLGVAIDRVSDEIAELNMMHQAGAISAADHARYLEVLTGRATQFQARAAMANQAMVGGARSAKLQAHEMLNLSRQFADIGVTAAMGMNPLMILIQQGPQIADVLGTARSRGIGTADAFKQIGGSIMPWVSRLATPLIGISAALAVVGLAARGASNEINTSMKGVQAEFGFTEKQMDRLKEKGTDLGFTMGDTFAGIGAAIADAFNFDSITKAVNDFFDKLGKEANDAVEKLVYAFGYGIGWIKTAFTNLPASVAGSLVSILNIIIDNLNIMMERGTRVINNFLSVLPKWAGGGTVMEAGKIMNVENPWQGQMDKNNEGGVEGGNSAVAAYRKGRAGSRKDRITEDAGEAEAGRKVRERKPQKSDEEKDWESAIESARDYTKSLVEATQEIGKNQFEVKRLATARKAAELEAAAAATGRAGAMAEAAAEVINMTAATEAWIKATNDQKIKDMNRALEDEAAALKFENSLIGMNAEQRARATKTREISIQILDAERQGHYGVAEALRAQAREVINLTGATAAWQDKASEAQRVADVAQEMADNVRSATEGFGELFGTIGDGFSNVMTGIYDYLAAQEEVTARLADLETQRQTGQIDELDYIHQRDQAKREQANNEVAMYGQMITAAKGFFKEGSTGYKVLEAAERAYRLFRFAMQIKSMVMDTTETASSVSKSGIRAAASGVEAVAKAIASLPFPLNIAAGAATIAFLAAIGVKMFGGKGGGGAGKVSATTEAASKEDPYNGPRDEYGAPTSGYSVLRPGQTNVAGTWNRGGAGGAGGGVNIGPTTLVVQGSLDSATLPQVAAMLNQNRQEVVQETRQVVARDIAERSGRQRIGGG